MARIRVLVALATLALPLTASAVSTTGRIEHERRLRKAAECGPVLSRALTAGMVDLRECRTKVTPCWALRPRASAMVKAADRWVGHSSAQIDRFCQLSYELFCSKYVRKSNYDNRCLIRYSGPPLRLPRR